MKICFTFVLLLFAETVYSQTWQKAAAFPGAIRDGAIEFSLGSNIYFGCGGVNDFWEFNTTTNTWTKKASISTNGSRGFATAFSIGNKGYVGLGTANGTIFHDMWEFDPATNKWTKKADYPAGDRDANLCFVMNGKAYIGGGTDNKYIYKEFFEFDPAANTWTALDDLPMGGVAFPSSFVIGSLAYVTGGDLGTGNGQLSGLYSFNPVSKEWKTLTDFPGAARQTAVAFTIGDKGYVGLGQADYDTVFTDFYSYLPAADSWKRVNADFPITPGRAWASGTAVGGKAFIGGGWDFKANFFNDWWEFDTTSFASVAAKDIPSGLTVYPNPVTTSFRLTGVDNPSFADLRIFDVSGNECSILKKSSEGLYDISNLSTGEYFLRITDQRSSYPLKIIKK